MRSNVCKIEIGTSDLEAILKESERVAAYSGLTHKQTLQLRLLCEELDGMLPNIVEYFEGDFWIECDNGVCEIHASIKIPVFDADKKEELIAVSKNKKNAAAVGIVGKIRNILEDLFIIEEPKNGLNSMCGTYYFSPGYVGDVEYPYLWSLEQYRTTVKAEEQAKEWDELEKSVIASVADDVIVGVKGKQADIIIVKKFA